jgi:uncharacterized protein DUF3298
MKKILLVFIVSVLFVLNIYPQTYTVVQKELKDKSKKLNYEFSAQYPQINSFNRNTGQAKMFNDYMKNKAYALKDTFVVWMKDWDTISGNKEMQSYYEAGDSVFYAKGNIMSILFSEGYYFSGAAHPNNSSFSVNYNMDKGNEFQLNDLLKTGWEEKISGICIKDLVRQKKELGIEPDEWLNEGAGPKAENFKVFNITNDHLLITFPTYQVGSYVEGPSEVEITYSSIKDIIKSEGLLGGYIK